MFRSRRPRSRPRSSPNAIADPAALYTLGSARTGAVWMGNHMWVSDAAAGFCKVDITLAAPSLTACAVLPAGFVAGSPAFDKAGNRVYLPDTTAGGAGIVKLLFNPATETVGAATTVAAVSSLSAAAGAGATAPTSLAFGPDNQIYAAMGGTKLILRITAPSTNTHKVTFIGAVNDVGSASIAFHNADLWDAEKTNASTLFNATLCQGTCQAQFFAVIFRLASSVTSDGAYVYIGDGHLAGTAPGDRLWRFDPVANAIQIVSTMKLMNGVLTPLNSVSGIALDGAGNIYAADADGIWEASLGVPAITSLAPFQAPESSTQAVTINGTGFLPGSVIQTCPAIAVSNAVLVNPTQITATFGINPVGPLGTCAVTVATQFGASAAASFTVLPGPPALTSIAPNSAFAGAVTASTVPVVILGANLTNGTVSVGGGVTATITAITDTQLNATLSIPPTAGLGAQNVTVATPSGTSNALTFTVNAPPSVLTSITPAQGGAGTTVPVVLSGSALVGATLNLPAGITLSGAPVVSATSISAKLVIAANATGPTTNTIVSISATTPGGTSNALAFTILPAGPTMTSIAPASGTATAPVLVTLTGTNFDATSAINSIPGIAVTNVVVVSSTQITAQFTISPIANGGTHGVTVTTQFGASAAKTFTVLPSLSSISPASGTAATNVSVTLTGTNLDGATTINAGAGITVSSLVVVNSIQITATFAIASNAAQGNRNITVTTPSGTTNPVALNILPPPPVITSISSPFSRGSNNQGVTLQGANFTGANAISAIQVFLNGVSVPLVVTANPIPGSIIIQGGQFQTSATQLRWNWTIPTTLPASSGANVYTITVTTPSGTSAPFVFTVN